MLPLDMLLKAPSNQIAAAHVRAFGMACWWLALIKRRHGGWASKAL
jgi:hypothetical protein